MPRLPLSISGAPLSDDLEVSHGGTSQSELYGDGNREIAVRTLIFKNAKLQEARGQIGSTAPLLGPWGTSTLELYYVCMYTMKRAPNARRRMHLCTCNRAPLRLQGLARPRELTRRNARLPGAVRERGIFLAGLRPAPPPFIPSDVKLWQTTSFQRLNELRRCTRLRGPCTFWNWPALSRCRHSVSSGNELRERMNFGNSARCTVLNTIEAILL